MATYVTKKCPHCHYAYQVLGTGDQRKYGCPQRRCLKCFGLYWDTDIKEPALYGYKNAHEIVNKIRIVITAIVCIPMGVAFLGGGALCFTEKEPLPFCLFCIAIGCIFLGAFISFAIRKIRDRLNRDEIITEQQHEYDESMERLADINYLTALAQYDSKAEKLLSSRKLGEIEKYAPRPELKNKDKNRRKKI